MKQAHGQVQHPAVQRDCYSVRMGVGAMKTLIEGAITLALCALVCYGLVQWATGCGEHYVDYKGVTHIIQCN